MQLNVTYDTNTLATAPSSFYSAVNYVVSLFDSTFTNSATVNIEVGYGDFPYDGSQLGSDLGESQQNNVVSATYSQVTQALVNEGASGANTLPSSSPISGQLELGSAQEKALGLIGSSSALDGWVGIASNAELQQFGGDSWSFSPTATPAATEYYLVGVIEHEFSEVMGRSSFLDIRGEYGVIDLYRYAGAGVHRTGTGDPAYFSIDNGVTNLDSFNDPRIAAGDLADWAPNAGPGGLFQYAGADAFDNNSLPGQINGLSSTDLTVMAALGWDAPIDNTSPDDFNGDGKADILWRYSNGDVGLWNSNPGVVSFTGQDLAIVGFDWTIQAVADFNGDGKADILWRYSNGDVGLWDSNPGAVSFTGQDLAIVTSDWTIQAAADFNGDGKADILWRDSNGDVGLWDSNPGAVSFTGQDLGIISSDWRFQAAADFNGDGKADSLWRNNNGDVGLWNSNPGTTSFTFDDLGAVSADWRIEKAADYTGDGKADILWRNNNGDVGLWASNAGLDSFTGQDLGIVSSGWHISA